MASAPDQRSLDGRRLDAGKLAMVIALGAILWFVGIFQIRWADQIGVLGNRSTPLVFALIFVATIPFIWLTPRVLGLPRAYRLHCGAIMGATASLLDGVAVRWTHWYASDPQRLANSAATLLWAIGVAVALGFAMSIGGADEA
jgi:uncharacterized membrane protein YbhN (UPF0104 family)